jgi:hypothetical protein
MDTKEFIKQYDLRKYKDDMDFLKEINKEIRRIDDIIANHESARVILSNLKNFYLSKHEDTHTIIP